VYIFRLPISFQEESWAASASSFAMSFLSYGRDVMKSLKNMTRVSRHYECLHGSSKSKRWTRRYNLVLCIDASMSHVAELVKSV
jgi:hypothetical protein